MPTRSANSYLQQSGLMFSSHTLVSSHLLMHLLLHVFFLLFGHNRCRLNCSEIIYTTVFAHRHTHLFNTWNNKRIICRNKFFKTQNYVEMKQPSYPRSAMSDGDVTITILYIIAVIDRRYTIGWATLWRSTDTNWLHRVFGRDTVTLTALTACLIIRSVCKQRQI